jgi:hypothetical protein
MTQSRGRRGRRQVLRMFKEDKVLVQYHSDRPESNAGLTFV